MHRASTFPSVNRHHAREFIEESFFFLERDKFAGIAHCRVSPHADTTIQVEAKY